MEKFTTVLNIANKQPNLGVGFVALLTAGGEQIFSSTVFRCPCSELNFLYGLVFLLVPALALLLLGYILSNKTWKLLTGVCQRRAKLCRWRKLVATGTIMFQISTTALVAPCSWIAVALLNGNYYTCAMTGLNVSTFNQHLCGDTTSQEQCVKELYKFPCDKGTGPEDRQTVLLTLKAQSQILGWLLVASIMLSSLLLTCMARCSSPISYLQLKFWRAYVQEESNLMDSYTTKHAKELAERNLASFFKQTEPATIITPSNKDWQKISTLYKFNTNNQYYSTLHQYVENIQVSDGMIRAMSVKSNESNDTPAVLQFVDEGRALGTSSM